MLQQTTVAAVIPYYEKWVKIFPCFSRVAQAPLSQVLKTWQGLGYYQRARNIHKTSKIVSSEYGGVLPRSQKTLRTLPGLGPYTVAAVSSIAFGASTPLVDANVRRVVMRLEALGGAADTKKDNAILAFLNKVVPPCGAGVFNQALMELGALICSSNAPRCPICPVRGFCRAAKNGLQGVIPSFRRRERHKIEAVVAVIEKNGAFFLQKRPSRGLLAGMWEFTGGKIEEWENEEAALKRELKEELGVILASATPLAIVDHAYTKFQVRLHAYRCRVKPLPKPDRTHKWVSLRMLEKFPLPSGTVKIIEKLK